MRVIGAAVEEEGVVGSDGGDQEHTYQMQDREQLSQQYQARSNSQYGKTEGHHNASSSAGGAQKDQEQHDDAGEARQREPDDLRQIARIQAVDFAFDVQDHGLHTLSQSNL